MLGLKKGTVRLSEHNEQWKIIFQRIKGELLEVIGEDVDIEHVGSTAIAGIKAKPILDIALGVRDKSSFTEVKAKLEARGYDYRGDKGDHGGQLFIKSPTPETRTQHLHVVEITGRQWQDYLVFRDFLNSHPESARAYERLKIELAEKYADNRALYTLSKQQFIEDILQMALK